MNERFLRASWFITAMLFAATLSSIAGAATEEGVGSPSDSGDPGDAHLGTAHGPATATVVDLAGQRQNRVTKKHTRAASAPLIEFRREVDILVTNPLNNMCIRHGRNML